jgi:anti-sigma-K factor RskA
MGDDEVREQLALHAVGALDGHERNALETLLRERPDLQAELADMREAASVLADAAPGAPPSGLRRSVLDAIAQAPPMPTEGKGARTPGTGVVPLRPKRRRFVALSAAAAGLLIVAGVLIATPWDHDGEDPVAAIVTADDAVEIPMRPTGETGAVPDLVMMHSPAHNATVLIAENAPLPDGDRVYELWAIHDGTPRRSITFRPHDDGRVAVHAAGLDPHSADAWVLTEEPAGGTDAPTGPPLNVSS